MYYLEVTIKTLHWHTLKKMFHSLTEIFWLFTLLKTSCFTFFSSLLGLFQFLFMVWRGKKKVHIDGRVEPGFEKVAQAFRDNLLKRGEKGAAFSVYYRGEKVVDIWGGYSDYAARRLWQQDTVTLFYSSTKAMTAVIIGMLVDRGQLNYDRPVCDYWPEFAENGKEKITVKMLMSHQAGLVNVKDKYKLSLLRDNPDKLGQILAKQTPSWQPGTAQGYHAITYGLYADQLVRRVDPMKRSLAQFFQDEIAKPFDLDIHIGLPKEHHHRATRNRNVGYFGVHNFFTIVIPTVGLILYRFFRGILLYGNTHHQRFLGNPRDMRVHKLNDPDFRELGIGSSHGFGTARAVAKLCGIIGDNGSHEGNRLLSQNAIDRLQTPESSQYDIMVLREITYGPGTTLMERKTEKGKKYYAFGHWGLGGQMAFSDTHKNLGWCYVTNYNNILHGFIWDHRYAALQSAMYECVEDIEKHRVNTMPNPLTNL